jgi:hypothetical protein
MPGLFDRIRKRRLCDAIRVSFPDRGLTRRVPAVGPIQEMGRASFGHHARSTGERINRHTQLRLLFRMIHRPGRGD